MLLTLVVELNTLVMNVVKNMTLSPLVVTSVAALGLLLANGQFILL